MKGEGIKPTYLRRCHLSSRLIVVKSFFCPQAIMFSTDVNIKTK